MRKLKTVILNVMCAGLVLFLFSCSNLESFKNSITARTPLTFTLPTPTLNPVKISQWQSSLINPTATEVLGQPLIVNLTDDNADGKIDTDDVPDIVFISYIKNSDHTSGLIRAIRGDDCAEIFTIPAYTHRGWSNIASGDIDNDGFPEIVAATSTQRINAYNHDGSFKWQSAVLSSLTNYPSVTIADLNHDGIPEIIIGNMVLDNAGVVKWQGANASGYNYAAIAVDLDCTADMEVINGYTAYRSNGTIYWSVPAIGTAVTSMASADFNADGFPEIVFVAGAKLYLVSHDGIVLWGPKSTTLSSAGATPSVADFDGDGVPEICFVDISNLYMFEADGTLKWSKPVAKDLSSGTSGISAFDFFNDGSMEVLLNDEEKLKIFNGSDGTLLWSTAVGNGTLYETPVIADVNNDSRAEIVVVANTLISGNVNHGILVFGDLNKSWPDTRKIWNQNAYYIDNVTDSGAIPKNETYSWLTHNTFRSNPVIPRNGTFDLTAANLRFNKINATDATITVTLGNSCHLGLSKSIFISFYNGDPSAGGVRIKTVSYNNHLAPYVSADVSTTWLSVPAGTINLFVKVDDDGKGNDRIREIDELNNVTSKIFSN